MPAANPVNNVLRLPKHRHAMLSQPVLASALAENTFNVVLALAFQSTDTLEEQKGRVCRSLSR